MADNVSDTATSSPALFIPAIVLDILGVGLSVIAVCMTSFLVSLIFVRRRLIKPKERILFILSLNMYVNVFLFAIFTLDMFVTMAMGHLNPTREDLHTNTLWCRLKIYISTIALISALYSNALQGLHRFFRIIYHTRPMFYRNIYVYLFCIVVQVQLGALVQLPVLLPGHYDYEDYHCQVYLTNWRGILTGAICVWLPPVSFTLFIYVRTVYYMRDNVGKFTMRQKKRAKRDLVVIRRVFWLVIFVILFGTPACSTTIVYHIFGYIGWWANHLTWLTFITSFICMSIVHTYYSPHLRVLWIKL